MCSTQYKASQIRLLEPCVETPDLQLCAGLLLMIIELMQPCIFTCITLSMSSLYMYIS